MYIVDIINKNISANGEVLELKDIDIVNKISDKDISIIIIDDNEAFFELVEFDGKHALDSEISKDIIKLCDLELLKLNKPNDYSVFNENKLVWEDDEELKKEYIKKEKISQSKALLKSTDYVMLEDVKPLLTDEAIEKYTEYRKKLRNIVLLNSDDDIPTKPQIDKKYK